MTRQQSPFSYLLFAMVALGWWPSLGTAAADGSPIECQVTSGLAGTWKIGFPTQHRLELRSLDAIEGSATIQTVDGDGVPVTYRDPAWSFSIKDGGGSAVIEMIAKHGRGNRPIRIQITDRNQKVLLDRNLTESERGTAIPATQPWVAGIGREVRLSQGAMRSLGSGWGEYAVSELGQLSDIPSHSDAYSGVDVLFFSSSSNEINEGLRSEQRAAIAGWTRQGGQIILTWGEHAMALAKYPDLMAMIPGELVATAASCEPGPVESLLGSQQQLQPMTCALVRLQQGRVEVGTLTSDRIKLPFLAKWAYGMGSVVWIATEIDSPQMLAWDTRAGLVKYLLKDAWEKSDNRATKQVFQSYDELTGQLNASLDTFSDLQLGNLGQLVLIAGLLALVIGPIDYFLVSRWWKRPRWTWWTLIAASLTTMIGTTVLAGRWKPRIPSLNALEIIDVDDQTRTLRGRSFIHYYAGRRGIYDFQAHHQSLSPSPQSGAKPKPESNRIDWLGQPGKGLGGFDSNVTTQLGLPAYSLNTLQSSSAREVLGLGFPAAGTKALFSEWEQAIEFPSGGNALTTVSGKDDLLQGSFTNPLSVDLLDATLYFAGRAYTIPARIRPGERIPITTAIPKDIARRLQRRTFVAGEEQGVEWNPNDTGNTGRLAELLSFHRSSGASSYTGLSNRYLSVLECSDLLKLERAVVFGYIAEPVSTWTSRRNQVPVQTLGGKQVSVVRLTLKVQNNNPSTSPTREYSIPIRP